MATNRTFTMLKPDAVEKGHIGAILEKINAVLDNRKLMGATNPKEAEEGTLRKKYGISIDKNSVHGSDSIDNAKKEIKISSTATPIQPNDNINNLSVSA